MAVLVVVLENLFVANYLKTSQKMNQAKIYLHVFFFEAFLVVYFFFVLA